MPYHLYRYDLNQANQHQIFIILIDHQLRG